MDVIADLALPVPSTMICEMMGVPLADRDRFTEWTARVDPPARRGHARAARGARARPRRCHRARRYFTELIDERRHHLTDDILSDLIRAEEAGDRLSPTELISQSIGLLIAGFETTIGLIGNGVLALLRHPDQLALPAGRPDADRQRGRGVPALRRPDRADHPRDARGHRASATR